MNALVQQVNEAGYTDRILTERQLARILGGSNHRRYGLVKRALKAGALVRVKRGHYVLSDQFRNDKVHPFSIAQALVAGSYVSMETALAFHGWIPEAVYSTSSVTPGRKSKEVEHSVWGRFTFHPLTVHPLAFLENVERLQIMNQTMLVATPIRALLDMVAYKKTEWKGLDWIEHGLRIDREHLLATRKKDLASLQGVYKQRRVVNFLERLDTVLASERSQLRRSKKG